MNFWDLLYRTACVFLVILFGVGLVLVFVPALREYQEYTRRQAETVEQIRHIEERIQILKEKQKQFHQDPRFVERLAHDRGMARPEETIFRFRETEDSGRESTRSVDQPNP